MPVVLIHGTDFGPPFFVTDSEEEQRKAVKQVLDGWAAMTRLSRQGSPPVEIKGANHLTIIAYQEYAGQVAAAIRGIVENVRGAAADSASAKPPSPK